MKKRLIYGLLGMTMFVAAVFATNATREVLAADTGDTFLTTGDVTSSQAIPAGRGSYATNATGVTSSEAILASSSSDITLYKTWGRTQLALTDDGSDKVALYDAIGTYCKNASNTTATMTYMAGEATYLMGYLNVTNSVTVDDLLEVYDSYKYDHPEYYWLDFSVIYQYTISGGVEYVTQLGICTSEDYDTPAERTAVSAVITTKLAEYDTLMTGLTTNYQKAKAIHDKMIADIDYTFDANGDPEESLYAHNIAGILTDVGGVCEGYAKAYQYLLNRYNVPNIYIVGYGGEGANVDLHAWSMVMMDDTYDTNFYYVDTTWDDAAEYGVVYDYFLNGTSSFTNYHMPFGSDGEGFYYLYPLPSVPNLVYTARATGTSITGLTVTMTSSYSYTGYMIEPVITIKNGTKTLVKDTDYTVSCTDNISVGTANVVIRGSGNYYGTLNKTFTIKAVPLSASYVTLSQSLYTYDGKVKTPGVTVKIDGEKLTQGTDYTLTYTNNKAVGTATATIKGTGNYTGTITKTFRIAYSISGYTATLSTTSYTYNGSARTPGITLKNGTTTLVKGTDYIVTYSANTSPGIATVKIVGTGKYTESITKTFTIKPKTPTVTGTGGTKVANISWSNVTGDTGYVVYMATSQNGTYSKLYVANSSTLKYQKTALTTGKTYYFKVRSYKKSGTTYIYSAYSSIVPVKVK